MYTETVSLRQRLLETKEALGVIEADPVSFINGKLGPSRVP